MRNIALAVAAIIAASWAGPAAAGDKGKVVELDGLKSTAPAAWKQMEPDPKLGRFRVNQFAIPKSEGDKEDAELVIFFFGKGSGGGTADNVKRWKGMFAAPAGKTIDDLTKIEMFKVGDVDITYVTISGTYLTKFPPFAPNAKVIPKENYRFIGVIFDSKDGPYFMRVTGAARTVDANKEGFDKWLKGFK
jgi:hypothetical protein